MFHNRFTNSLNDDYHFNPMLRRKYYEQKAQREEARRRAAMEERFYQDQAIRRQEQEAEAMRRRGSTTISHNKDETEEEKEPRYAIVRGRDGYLYRVRIPEDGTDNFKQHAKAKGKARETRNNPSVTATDSREVKREDDETRSTGNMEKPQLRVTPLPKQCMRKSAAGKKRIPNVVVEDASDSETEDEELNSVWRNRRPSPGQWMEPVDGM